MTLLGELSPLFGEASAKKDGSVLSRTAPSALRRAIPGKAPFLLLLGLVFAASCGGCAFMNKENTPLLNAVEDNLWPESTTARVALFPVVAPTGLAALVTDAVVVHPVSVIDDAAGDTGDVLWKDWNFKEHYVTECVSIPWRALLTPLFFSLDFLGRTFFDIPPRKETGAAAETPAGEKADRGGGPGGPAGPEETIAARRKKLRAALDEAEGLLADKKPAEALAALTDPALVGAVEEPARRTGREENAPLLARLRFLTLEAARDSGRYDSIDPAWAPSLRKGPFKAETDTVLAAMRWSKDPAARWAAFGFDMARGHAIGKRIVLIRQALADASPQVRLSALFVLEHDLSYPARARDSAFRGLRVDLERMARGDADPVVRAFAGRLKMRIEREPGL